MKTTEWEIFCRTDSCFDCPVCAECSGSAALSVLQSIIALTRPTQSTVSLPTLTRHLSKAVPTGLSQNPASKSTCSLPLHECEVFHSVCEQVLASGGITMIYCWAVSAARNRLDNFLPLGSFQCLRPMGFAGRPAPPIPASPGPSAGRGRRW